jgi:hypothetical protein
VGNKYSISVRLDYGSLEDEIYKKTCTISDKYKLSQYAVWYPHITLFGPFEIDLNHHPDEIFPVIEGIAKKYSFLPFSIDGWHRMHSQGLGWVIAHNVKLSIDFENFYQKLGEKLYQISWMTKWTDMHPDSKYLHISILTQIYDEKKAFQIWEELEKDPAIKPLFISLDALRITVKGKSFFVSYDLPRKKWLTGNQAWDKKEWQQTLVELKKLKASTKNEQAL